MPLPLKSTPRATPGVAPAVDRVDTAYLETLLGYNARRVSLTVIEHFTEGMTQYDLSPVDFSILSLVMHNPGITSRQLCTALKLLPPNLVGKINMMKKRDLLTTKPHPEDGRAIGLHMTDEGTKLMVQAEKTASRLENEAAKRLGPSEKKTLLRLLQKIYF